MKTEVRDAADPLVTTTYTFIIIINRWYRVVSVKAGAGFAGRCLRKIKKNRKKVNASQENK